MNYELSHNELMNAVVGLLRDIIDSPKENGTRLILADVIEDLVPTLRTPEIQERFQKTANGLRSPFGYWMIEYHPGVRKWELCWYAKETIEGSYAVLHRVGLVQTPPQCCGIEDVLSGKPCTRLQDRYSIKGYAGKFTDYNWYCDSCEINLNAIQRTQIFKQLFKQDTIMLNKIKSLSFREPSIFKGTF